MIVKLEIVADNLQKQLNDTKKIKKYRDERVIRSWRFEGVEERLNDVNERLDDVEDED